MVKEITKKQFEKKFPDVSTYGLDEHNPVYLDNGMIALDTEWNGEYYTLTETNKIVMPVYDIKTQEIVGYSVY